MTVVQLTYAIASLSPVRTLIAQPPSEFEVGEFCCLAADTTLNARPRVAFGTMDGARAALECLLRAYEVELSVLSGTPFRFEFTGGEEKADNGGHGLEIVRVSDTGVQMTCGLELAGPSGHYSVDSRDRPSAEAVGDAAPGPRCHELPFVGSLRHLDLCLAGVRRPIESRGEAERVGQGFREGRGTRQCRRP